MIRSLTFGGVEVLEVDGRYYPRSQFDWKPDFMKMPAIKPPPLESIDPLRAFTRDLVELIMPYPRHMIRVSCEPAPPPTLWQWMRQVAAARRWRALRRRKHRNVRRALRRYLAKRLGRPLTGVEWNYTIAKLRGQRSGA